VSWIGITYLIAECVR